MAEMFRSKFVWAGAAGLPGYTTLYGRGFGSSQPFATAAGNFMTNVFTISGTARQALPLNTTITQDGSITRVEDTTGVEMAIDSVTPVAPIVGTGGLGYAQPAGAVINWMTSTFINGRRLRGKTYVVPLAANSYESNGTLSSLWITGAGQAITAFIGSGNGPVVWHRPTTKGGSDGTSILAATGLINDRAAVLRSRRG